MHGNTMEFIVFARNKVVFAGYSPSNHAAA